MFGFWKKASVTVEVVGVVERLGSMPGFDDTTYVIRLVGDTTLYRIYGTLMSLDERNILGVAFALTQPGDNVRLRCQRIQTNPKRASILTFENVSYPTEGW